MPQLGKCPECKNSKDVILLGGLCHTHFATANVLHDPETIKKVADKAKVKPIKKVSAKRAAQEREYKKLRKEYLKVHPICEAALPQCSKVATDIHHKAGRGKHLLNTDTWMASCRNCHTYIETHPAESKERGFSLSRLNK